MLQWCGQKPSLLSTSPSPPPRLPYNGKLSPNRSREGRAGIHREPSPQMNKVFSVSSPKAMAMKKAGEVGSQLMLNSLTDSFTEPGCQSFRITDSIHIAYQKVCFFDKFISLVF